METPDGYTTDDEKWNALATRDGRADGAFLYAVRTTGVFCRPSCTSRRPNRVNVEFFPTCEDAERRGYRACKMCEPKAAGSIPDAVLRACRMIEQAEEEPTLEELAEAVGHSPFYFHKLFKSVVGVTPKAFAAARRGKRFRDGMKEHLSVTEAIYDAGFRSSSRFYEKVGDELGMTPTQYRRGGEGQTIRLAVVESHIGWLAVAATERGVCMIELGDTPDALREVAMARFPNAHFRVGDDEFRCWVAAVVQHIEMPGRATDLPLDVHGTAFQRKVWKALREIPSGVTATYKEIAEKIGKPSAVRAVAGACAANTLAVVVPCHRVVRSGGGRSGYRWGIERKQLLLERESASDESD